MIDEFGMVPLPSPLNESTSAELRRVKAELGSALTNLNRLTSQLAQANADLATLRDEVAERAHRELLLTAELNTARADIERRKRVQIKPHCGPPLPANDDEIRAWYADHGLAMSCGPAVLFAALRRYFNQSEPEQGATPA